MKKLINFFFKKRDYEVKFCGRISINHHTPFQHWFIENVSEPIDSFFYGIRNFNFYYDIVYKQYKRLLKNKRFVAYDSWNLDYSLAEYIVPRVLWLMNNKQGVILTLLKDSGYNIKDGNPTKEEFDKAYNCQKEILWEIAKSFATYRLNTVSDSDKDKAFRKGTKLLFKYYYLLWD